MRQINHTICEPKDWLFRNLQTGNSMKIKPGTRPETRISKFQTRNAA